ncbi:MAG: hypothetical protein C5B47_00030 [Verrucomicrobia bacterium]|nr:MAG: hypothetical protein C5B47_00030 [Verrucomicrobiota bacterium]
MNASATCILALSTAWNFQRHRSGKAMLEEIAALGFDWAELHQGLHPDLLPEIAEFVDQGGIRISHLRNLCFSPLDGFGGPQFTADEEEEQTLAVCLTQQTINHAVLLKAKAVILRCGSAIGLKSHQDLLRLALRDQLYTKPYALAKIREIFKREKESPVLKRRVVRCLRELGNYAAERGIRLAIENCEAYEAFPTERELPSLLDELNHPAFGYWHNFRYAQVKDSLTLLDHQQWLEKIGRRAIGASIDDLRGLDQASLPPFTGEIAYYKLMPLLPECSVFVLDLKGFTENGALVTSAQRWESTFCK